MNVALGPLLNRTIHVNSVDLVRPKLSLVTDSNGKDNYTFTPPPRPQSAESRLPRPQIGESSSVSLDQIDSINLTDAEVLVGAVVRGAGPGKRRHQGHQYRAAQFRRDPHARA